MKGARVIRWAWLTLVALLFVLLTAGGHEAVFPSVGIALISFPAGLLAAPVTSVTLDFPVAIEGMPFPPTWWIEGLLALAFGSLQWFVLLPTVARRLTAWHRATRMG